MPVGTAVHARTFALCESLNHREWSGYYAVRVYETHHEHEYNAISRRALSTLGRFTSTGSRAGTPCGRSIDLAPGEKTGGSGTREGGFCAA